MNIEHYTIHKIIPNGKTDQAWKAFQEKERLHNEAILQLMNELGSESCATDRGGIAGINFKETPDQTLWRRVPGTLLWMPRAKTNRELYKRMQESVYETNGWWIFQKILMADREQLMFRGMTMMWPVVKQLENFDVLLMPDCRKDWEPEDCESMTISEYYASKGK